MKISLSKRILSQAAAAALAVLFVFPIYWMIVTSLKPNASILRLPLEFWPGEFAGANYRAILSDGLFPIYYKNNLIVSLATTVLTLLIAIMAAYAFSRFPFRGSRALQMLFLSTQMFPAVVLLIALYSLYAKLGLINTYTALILACSTNALPMSIWILKGFFDTVSKSLEEAAYIDGASRGYSMVRIIVPLVQPGILAVGLYSFLISWEDFLWGLNLVNRLDMRTLASGISLSYLGEYTYDWGKVMAATVSAALPVLVAFIFLQRYLISGLTAGAIKE